MIIIIDSKYFDFEKDAGLREVMKSGLISGGIMFTALSPMIGTNIASIKPLKEFLEKKYFKKYDG